jgi:hypothetical protein
MKYDYTQNDLEFDFKRKGKLSVYWTLSCREKSSVMSRFQYKLILLLFKLLTQNSKIYYAKRFSIYYSITTS